VLVKPTLEIDKYRDCDRKRSKCGLLRIANGLGIQKIRIDQTGENHAGKKRQDESPPISGQLE